MDSELLFEGSARGIRRYASTVPKPFRAFNMELHFNHPYWTVIKCDMEAPLFDNNLPDVNDYIRLYRQSIKEIEKLVTIFKTVAFLGALQQSVCLSTAGVQEVHTTIELHADTIKKNTRRS